MAARSRDEMDDANMKYDKVEFSLTVGKALAPDASTLVSQDKNWIFYPLTCFGKDNTDKRKVYFFEALKNRLDLLKAKDVIRIKKTASVMTMTSGGKDLKKRPIIYDFIVENAGASATKRNLAPSARPTPAAPVEAVAVGQGGPQVPRQIDGTPREPDNHVPQVPNNPRPAYGQVRAGQVMPLAQLNEETKYVSVIALVLWKTDQLISRLGRSTVRSQVDLVDESGYTRITTFSPYVEKLQEMKVRGVYKIDKAYVRRATGGDDLRFCPFSDYGLRYVKGTSFTKLNEDDYPQLLNLQYRFTSLTAIDRSKCGRVTNVIGRIQDCIPKSNKLDVVHIVEESSGKIMEMSVWKLSCNIDLTERVGQVRKFINIMVKWRSDATRPDGYICLDYFKDTWDTDA